MGLNVDEALTGNYLNERSRYIRVLLSPVFWVEALVLLLIPYPTGDGGVFKPSFTMTTINWVDNGGVYNAHSHEYETPY